MPGKMFGKRQTFRESLSSTTQEIRMPDIDVKNAVLYVFPGTGTASVKTTISHPDYIDAGTEEWLAWGYGEVAADTMFPICCDMTAIELKATSGTVIFEMLIRKDI